MVLPFCKMSCFLLQACIKKSKVYPFMWRLGCHCLELNSSITPHFICFVNCCQLHMNHKQHGLSDLHCLLKELVSEHDEQRCLVICSVLSIIHVETLGGMTRYEVWQGGGSFQAGDTGKRQYITVKSQCGYFWCYSRPYELTWKSTEELLI